MRSAVFCEKKTKRFSFGYKSGHKAVEACKVVAIADSEHSQGKLPKVPFSIFHIRAISGPFLAPHAK